MPDPKLRPTKKNQPKHHPHSPPPQHEVVDPIWLLKAIGLTVIAAAICGYITFCLLFYQGQWQLVLHPTRTSSSPSINGLSYENVKFGPDESAVPQLSSWWIPASPDAPYTGATILFLPGADGSLADLIPTLVSLHHIGVNIFAFDYRGYGQSAPVRPSQQNMNRDAESAWQYLTASRAIPAGRIVPYGVNVGASLATQLAIAHPQIPALILDSPHTDLLSMAQQDARSRLLPVSLLFHERFPLAQPLSTLHTPKLLISRSTTPDRAFQTASAPRTTVELASPSNPLPGQILTRFLNRYVPSTPIDPAPKP